VYVSLACKLDILEKGSLLNFYMKVIICSSELGLPDRVDETNKKTLPLSVSLSS